MGKKEDIKNPIANLFNITTYVISGVGYVIAMLFVIAFFVV